MSHWRPVPGDNNDAQPDESSRALGSAVSTPAALVDRVAPLQRDSPPQSLCYGKCASQPPALYSRCCCRKSNHLWRCSAGRQFCVKATASCREVRATTSVALKRLQFAYNSVITVSRRERCCSRIVHVTRTILSHCDLTRYKKVTGRPKSDSHCDRSVSLTPQHVAADDVT